MPELALDRAVVDLLAVGGAITGTLALLVALAAFARLRTLRRAASRFWEAADSDDVAAVVERQVAGVELLRREVDTCRAQVDVLGSAVTDAVRHVAVVRFDAFGDMGGRLSFSAALLDDGGDGLVLTSINGRSETRTYAKGVKGGGSEHTLSPEEEQAIGYALRRTARA